MKIVCDSCSAKYSIADEKVAGRVFKIRCKKCGAAIVVRGDQMEAPEEEPSTRVVDYGGDAVWHIVIDGDQQGPYSPGQIGEMLSVGTISWDAYVWREGFDDWKPAQDIEELVAAVMGEGGDEGQPAQEPAAASPEMGADPFASASEPAPAADPAGDLFGGGRNAGADLFGGGADSSPFGGDDEDDMVASAPSPRVSADQALTGARNENSVLFSLSNLQALATGSGDSSAPSSAPAGGGAKPGMATGEGSGLIDIRALASATGVMGNEGPITSANDDRVDDLLAIGGGGGGMGSSLGAPVLIAEQKEESSNKGLIIGLGIAGIVFVAAAAVIAVILVSDGDDNNTGSSAALGPVPSGQTTTTEGAPPATPNTTGAIAAPTPTETAPTPPPTETPEAAADGSGEAGGAEQAGEADEADEAPRAGRRRRAGRRGAPSGGHSASTPAPSSSHGASGGGGSSGSSRRRSGGDSIDSLLDDALAGGGGGGGRRGRSSRGGGSSSSGGGGGGGPATPSRSQVRTAMRGVDGAVQACGHGQHGMVPVHITFGSNGRVTGATASGSMPGPVRSCVARAARGAHVPQFTQPTFSINYPFRL